MQNLAIKAVAQSAGGFYYREEHEWRGIDAKMSAWFEAKLGELSGHIQRAGAKKDDGDIKARFDATIDGQVAPTIVVSGITRREMSQFQRMFHNIGNELVKIGEDLADEKDKKHKKK